MNQKNTALNNRTVAIMVSVGDRSNLTDYSFPRLSKWADRHGYSSILLKKDNIDRNRTAYFNKLIAHKEVPFFDRYIIVDDDILISSDAPAIPEVPKGMVGLAKDGEQGYTENPEIKWTANSGFIIAYKTELTLLEEAYEQGEYPYKCGDQTGKGIWGPHDQGILNHILFKENQIFEIDWKWNYQPVLDYYVNRGGGWNKWKDNRIIRITYYASLIFPFTNNRRILNSAYCVHMIKGRYPCFFNRIIK